MNGMLKKKIAICVLVLIVISVGYIFASDVTVQNGGMTLDNDLNVSGDAYIDYSLEAGPGPMLEVSSNNDYIGLNAEFTSLYNDVFLVHENSYFENLLLVADASYNVLYDELYVSVGSFFNNDPVNLYVLGGFMVADDYGDTILKADPYDDFVQVGESSNTVDLDVFGDFGVYNDEGIVLGVNSQSEDVQIGDYYDNPESWLGIYGYLDVTEMIGYGSGPDGYFSNLYANKIWCQNFDPPYVLYDQQSRSEIIDKIQKEIPPDKQNGASMFFNKETKKIENYVASEGKFYDLQGNVLHELAEVVKPTTEYETVYSFDKTTGQVISTQRAISEKYQIKKGYSLDSKTGHFINKESGKVVAREEALEICVASEGKIYDLDHNFVRYADKNHPTEVASTESAKANTDGGF